MNLQKQTKSLKSSLFRLFSWLGLLSSTAAVIPHPASNSVVHMKGKNLQTPPVLTCQRRSVTPWQPPASLSARLSCGRGTNPLPATSHALGIRSGRHPRSRGGQVPNPEPRGAKPPHQVHHGGTAAESPNMGRFCHFFKTFFPAAGPQDGGVGWGRHVR